jgi:hypothetical protein
MPVLDDERKIVLAAAVEAASLPVQYTTDAGPDWRVAQTTIAPESETC